MPDHLAMLEHPIKKLRIGIPREFTIGGMDPQVKSAVDGAIQKYRDLGAEQAWSLPSISFAADGSCPRG